MKLPDSEGLWAELEKAEMVSELRATMWSIVRRILYDPLAHPYADVVLARCATRPIFFEQGMCIAMIASAKAREEFRARLVECGAFLEAMRLAKTMNRPLSRAEVVALGNNCTTSFEAENAEKFFIYALAIKGVHELDLRRLGKQFGIEAAHIDLV